MTRFDPPDNPAAEESGKMDTRATTEYEANDIQRFDEDLQEKDRQFVTALARGLELLRCYGPGERFIGITELARRTGIPKPTVSRLAGTLTKLGYLRFSEAQGKYSLGPGVLSLGYAMLSNVDLRQLAKPYMQDLAEFSQGSVSLGIRDRLSMVYVESVRSSAPIALQHGVGARLALATSSIGRAYLAGIPEAERNFLMDQIRLRDEEHWPQIKAGVDQALRDYADYGFCISVGDWKKEIAAVGVPFRSADGSVMAFNCGGPAYVLTRAKLEEEIGPRLVSLVKKVGNMIGRL